MKFAITFGLRYSDPTLAHPADKRITDKHFVVIEADDEIAARKIASELTKNDYAFIYVFDADFQRQIAQYNLIPFPAKMIGKRGFVNVRV